MGKQEFLRLFAQCVNEGNIYFSEKDFAIKIMDDKENLLGLIELSIPLEIGNDYGGGVEQALYAYNSRIKYDGTE